MGSHCRVTVCLRLSSILFLAGCATRPVGPDPAETQRLANLPNVIVVIADGLGYGDLGCYGQKLMQTPNLDRLAAEGVRLTHFYAAAPAGHVTTWSLLSGHDTSSAGRKALTAPRLRTEEATLGELMQHVGLKSGFVGTWGLGDEESDRPGSHGFAEWTALMPETGQADLFPETLWKNGEKVPLAENANGQQVVAWNEIVMRETLAFLEQNKEGPFFLLVTHPLPALAQKLTDVSDAVAKDWPEDKQKYATAVATLDRDMGTLLEAVKGLGGQRRTAVFFTSSHGPARDADESKDLFQSTGGLRGGAGSLYDGGLRVPFLAKWWGQSSRGLEREYPAAIWDLMPTLIELTELKIPPGKKKLDGVSIASLLRGGIAKRDMLYWELHQDGGESQAVRIDDWKVVRPVGPEADQDDLELYNLIKDPAEKHNVAARHPDIVKKFIRKPAAGELKAKSSAGAKTANAKPTAATASKDKPANPTSEAVPAKSQPAAPEDK